MESIKEVQNRERGKPGEPGRRGEQLTRECFLDSGGYEPGKPGEPGRQGEPGKPGEGESKDRIPNDQPQNPNPKLPIPNDQ